jgi:hypothetical protein
MAKAARHPNDRYLTPALLTRQLLERVNLRGTILEPCAADMAMARELSSPLRTVLASDIDPSQPTTFHGDAADPAFWRRFGCDWVVTNPPFKLAETILPLAYDAAREGVAFLLRLTYLEPCNGRAQWLAEHADNLSDLIVFNPRPQFRLDTRSTDSATVAWMVWQKKAGPGTAVHFVHGWNQ